MQTRQSGMTDAHPVKATAVDRHTQQIDVPISVSKGELQAATEKEILGSRSNQTGRGQSDKIEAFRHDGCWFVSSNRR